MNKLPPTEALKVGIQFKQDVMPVGRLAIHDIRIYFEYDVDFLANGIEISPFKLPLSSGLQELSLHPFEGLPGVFYDSLPDGWGRLLFDRYVRSLQMLPEEFSPLDRLAHIGLSGLGALVYEPDLNISLEDHTTISLDEFAIQSKTILQGGASDVLKELIQLNGSSAGARPKALIHFNPGNNLISAGNTLPSYDFEYWLVKFANNSDGIDAGAIEYVYALMANEAGIDMMPVHLFETTSCAGYFATKRFDRLGNKRLHKHTASGLLHSDFRIPSLDYLDLLKITMNLTKDIREVEKMYRLAVFNVMSHNRDDHGKNFSFLMDDTGEWKLAPAYDLTFSSGPGGHHSTMVLGEGQTPTIDNLTQLGKEAGLKRNQLTEICDQTLHAISKWEKLANNYGVTTTNISLVKSRLML